ncbi:hypothetical protein JW935_22670 [candidate division KSB1 bacterium]|nr:hypothetical protein [candidate division KSB1 bacterium]
MVTAAAKTASGTRRIEVEPYTGDFSPGSKRRKSRHSGAPEEEIKKLYDNHAWTASNETEMWTFSKPAAG